MENFTTSTVPKEQEAADRLVLADLKLRDVIKTMPSECFEKNPRKAWSRVLLSVVAVAMGMAAIAVSPWFLLPFAWIFTGTALTGFFVVGHDCGHGSFAK